MIGVRGFYVVVLIGLLFVSLPVSGIGGIGTTANDRSPVSTHGTGVYIHPAVDVDDVRELVIEFDDRTATPADTANIAALRSKTIAAQSDSVASLRALNGITVVRRFWVTNAVLVNVSGANIDVETDLATVESVSAIYPNFEVHAPDPVSEQTVDLAGGDEQYTSNLEHVNAPRVWETFGTRGEGVNVAVLGTGVDTNHPDISLTAGGWAEFDAQGDRLDTEPHDPDGHGTHVSGIIVGDDQSGTHIGVSPKASLLYARVLDDGGTFAQVIAGIEWAVAQDADVITMSFGIAANDRSVYEPAFIEPIRTANEMGAVVVTSSGNTGPGLTGSPGNVHDAVSVGAVDADGEVASFTSGEIVNTSDSWGADAPADWPQQFIVPDVAAPGVDVVSSASGGGYVSFSGTSFAAPHAAGTLALLLSANASVSVTEAEKLLRSEAVHPVPERDTDIRYGTGIIDAHRTVTAGVYNSRLIGTVKTNIGTPLPAVSVRTDHGTSGLSDGDGHFSIPVPPGDRTVSTDPFGYTISATSVSVGSGNTSTADLRVEETVDARFSRTPPDTATTGTEFDFEMTAVNLDAVSVDIDGNRSDVTREDLTVLIDGRPVPLAELTPVEAGSPRTLVVTVRLKESASGMVTLALRFTGPGDDFVLVTDTIAINNPAIAEYANQQGVIDSDGLRSAVDDWRAGRITTQTFRSLVDSWRSGRTVAPQAGS